MQVVSFMKDYLLKGSDKKNSRKKELKKPVLQRLVFEPAFQFSASGRVTFAVPFLSGSSVLPGATPP